MCRFPNVKLRIQKGHFRPISTSKIYDLKNTLSIKTFYNN